MHLGGQLQPLVLIHGLKVQGEAVALSCVCSVRTMQGADKTLTLTAAVVRATRLGTVLGCCFGA